MNVVVLFGSPRENGYTSQLTAAFCASLPEDASVKTIKAYEMNVEPCYGCGFCENEWGCPLADDMDRIIAALLECDVLVIAAPVYHLSFPAPLKAIMDRTQRCFCAHRQGRSPFAEKERRAAVLLTAGSPSEDGEIIRRQLRWLLPPLNAVLSGMVVCADTDASGVSRDAVDRAAALAQSMTADGHKDEAE